MHREDSDQSDTIVVDVEFRATPLEVRATLATLREAWHQGGPRGDLLGTAEQILAEVLNNVVEHAQAGRPHGIVRLETVLDDDGITCRVRDDGAPMPETGLPEGRAADINSDLHSLPEGGFGWYMIRTCTLDLSYDRQNGWNQLSFRIAAGTDFA